MAYGSPYKGSTYQQTAQAVGAAGARQRARAQSPRAERENRMAQLLRMASYAAPALGTGLGMLGGATLGAAGGAVSGGLAGGGVGAIPGIIGGLTAGAGAGATAGGALGGAASKGLQGMADEQTMGQQEAAADDLPPELIMAILSGMR